MTEETPLKPLSKKHQAFVSEWLKCFNGTEAYLKVYTKAQRDSARANAAELLANPSVKAAVEEGLRELHMSAEEALKLQADIARGDIGELADGGGIMSLEEAKKRGLSHLIKKYKQKTVTIGEEEVEYVEVELYDRQAAIRDVLKVHGRFTEKVDLTSGGEKLKGYVGISPEDWKD